MVIELYFFRHAQGQHVLRPPQSLQMLDPSLTEIGEAQADWLQKTFPVSTDDLFIISPLRRTIQTALIWTNDVHCQKIVHPFIGPRMFPLLSAESAYGCDQILKIETIKKEFPQLEMANIEEIHWQTGINTIPQDTFIDLAKQFITWCKSLNKDRIFIVSHDGTITAYRQYLGEAVTRDHFLGDIGWHRVTT
ncbi:broad specificity phosphatase PhoE [Lederbergia galactosidilyticus]|uniref:phosphoglycerate mutase family protein n=1 Tax=Lederbergia galactosidilytica TaxID=217031 RepID=UPI001AE939A6|nr:histidine phosphatase family protein [Lederbergia galactosidilytica]MBP1917148.1 broad specificity phosphatase PhoE [Lederbergia galactosidilytica]